MRERPWVLVTGATGFVGARLVRHLVEEGERVRAFVRPGADLTAFAGLPQDRLGLAYGDVTVEPTVYRALAGCDRMFHLATVFRFWDARPERVLRPAVDGTRAVLRAARARGLARIVVTSSVAALGTTAEPVPMDETHRPEGPAPDLYALAKLRALEVAEESAASGTPVVIVMPSALAGPGDRRPTPVGAGILRYLGTRYRTPAVPGGVSIADVDDVVRGHALAMGRGAVGRRYVLGGENVTHAGLLSALSALTGLPPPGAPPNRQVVMALATLFELHARLTGDEPPLTRRLVAARMGRYSWASSERARAELGYTARPLAETLRRAIGWFVRHGRAPEPLARRLRYELEAR